MGILVLSRENSSYDPVTKKYMFNLDKPLEDHIKVIKIETASFKPATSDEYPHGVLLCSTALSTISAKDHATVLRSSNHRDHSDVLACLHLVEHNTTGIRFQLTSPIKLKIDRRDYFKAIDIYFTDLNGNKLAGDYVPVSDPGSNLEDIQAEHTAGRIGFFCDSETFDNYIMDSDDTSVVDAVDQTVYQWKATLPDDSSVIFTRSSEDGIVLKQFTKPADTTQVYGITTNGSGGAYEFMLDSDLGFDLADSGSLAMLWETDATLPGLEIIFQCGPLFNLVLMGQNLCIHGVNPSWYHTVIQNIQASTSYLVRLDWTLTGNSGGKNIFDYTVYLTGLSADGNHSEYQNSLTGIKRTANSAQRKQLYIGTAQTTLDSLFGSLIYCTDTGTATTKAHCKSFLIKQWRSQSTQPSVDPNAINASFLTEMRV